MEQEILQHLSVKHLLGLSLSLCARYDQVGLLYHWRLAAYCLWRSDQGELGYEGAALAEMAP